MGAPRPYTSLSTDFGTNLVRCSYLGAGSSCLSISSKSRAPKMPRTGYCSKTYKRSGRRAARQETAGLREINLLSRCENSHLKCEISTPYDWRDASGEPSKRTDHLYVSPHLAYLREVRHASQRG